MTELGVICALLLAVVLVARDAGWRPGSAFGVRVLSGTEVALWTVVAVVVLPTLLSLVA